MFVKLDLNFRAKSLLRRPHVAGDVRQRVKKRRLLVGTHRFRISNHVSAIITPLPRVDLVPEVFVCLVIRKMRGTPTVTDETFQI